MNKSTYVTMMIALIVALGGLLMGFDASVISGVVGFIEVEFELTKLELGWAVASLTLSSTLAMLVAGPISDRVGRRTVLRFAAVLYAISALASAVAPNFTTLVIARMIGGLGVGASLILAPMYIAEISPPQLRGRMVSFNQLNIVIGISLAFFTNYWILQLGKSDASWAQALKFDLYAWRWMLSLEILPAILFFFGLFLVPKSPRWLIMKGRFDEAKKIMARFSNTENADAEIEAIKLSLDADGQQEAGRFADLLHPALRLVLTIGIVVAILQQITGINAVFFYAPMIFEQSGFGTDSAFVQAIFVGLTNLAFTVLAILFIDKLGRRPLLMFGVAGIALSMFVLSYGFKSASYTLVPSEIKSLELVDPASFSEITQKTFEEERVFLSALAEIVGPELVQNNKSDIINHSISVNSMLILIALLAFVASFAISIGPVMWVLFSELFPNRIRGIAISFVGLINSAVSFLVQWVFPWELDRLGSAMTFLIYGLFAIVGFVFIVKVIPETKGKTLEELEAKLVKH
jgi:SP family arabinose:H+ symporter-like MFS transporter